MEIITERDNTYTAKYNILKTRIITLSEQAWEKKILWNDVENWLNNFDGSAGSSTEDEKLHALFILSQFLYFGNKQIRILLQSMYRDLIIIPLIKEIRLNNAQTRDINFIKKELRNEQSKTKYLGIGNPSESGVHLLYFFRQENMLSKKAFLDIAQLITTKREWDGNFKRIFAYPNIKRLIFIDDICGNGKTAIKYSKNALVDIKSMKNDIKFYYLTLIATSEGLENVRKKTLFGNNCAAVFELDPSYKILDTQSRYIADCPNYIQVDILEKLVNVYGSKLWKTHPRGFLDSQLLTGLHHNIPNNTIPIIWWNEPDCSWAPIFKRYPKLNEEE